MKHNEAMALLRGLQRLKGLKGLQLNHMIEQNIDRLKKEAKVLHKQENDIHIIIDEYEKKRIALNKEFATDADGNIKTKMEGSNQVFDIPKEKEEDFTKRLNDLMAEFAEPLKEHGEKMKEFRKFLEEEDSKFKPMFIPMGIIPGDIVTEDWQILSPLVNKSELNKA